MTGVLCRVHTRSQRTYDTLIVVTPAVSSSLPAEATTNLRVTLSFSSGQTLYTSTFFDYHQNPVLTGVSPTTHLIRYTAITVDNWQKKLFHYQTTLSSYRPVNSYRPTSMCILQTLLFSGVQHGSVVRSILPVLFINDLARPCHILQPC